MSLGKDFATKEFVQTQAALGDYVALALRILVADAKYTEGNEPYLSICARDVDGALINNLRLWRFLEDDVSAGKCYIVRGLKVVLETYWD